MNCSLNIIAFQLGLANASVPSILVCSHCQVSFVTGLFSHPTLTCILPQPHPTLSDPILTQTSSSYTGLFSPSYLIVRTLSYILPRRAPPSYHNLFNTGLLSHDEQTSVKCALSRCTCNYICWPWFSTISYVHAQNLCGCETDRLHADLLIKV